MSNCGGCGNWAKDWRYTWPVCAMELDAALSAITPPAPPKDPVDHMGAIAALCQRGEVEVRSAGVTPPVPPATEEQ